MLEHRPTGQPSQSDQVRLAFIWFLGISLALWLIALGAAALCGWVLHLPYPRNWVLYAPWNRFSDLTDYAQKCRRLVDGYSDFSVGLPAFNYPAPAIWIYVFILAICPNAIAAFLTLAIAPLLGAAYLSYRALAKSVLSVRFVTGFVILVVLASFPFWWGWDRGNLEVIVWGFIFGFFVCLIHRRYLLAALFLGLGVCIKPFPALLFLLLLDRGHYKEIAAGVSLAVAMILAALAGIGPTIAAAYESLSSGWRYYFERYAISYDAAGIGVDHSMFTVVKQLARFYVGFHNKEALVQLLKASYIPYLVFCAILGIVIFGIYLKLPTVNKMFALIILMVLVPPSSYEYTFIHLYFPLTAALIFFAQDVASKRHTFSLSDMLRVLVPCAIVLSPLSFLVIGEYTAVGGQVKTFALLYLLFFGATRPMPSSLFHENSVPAHA